MVIYNLINWLVCFLGDGCSFLSIWTNSDSLEIDSTTLQIPAGVTATPVFPKGVLKMVYVRL